MNYENESGADRLRRVVRVINMTRESALDGFNAHQIIRMVEACWASDWDITPCDLTREEREQAADQGILTDECLARLQEKFG